MNKKLVSETRVWFGSLGWICGGLSQYLVGIYHSNLYYFLGLVTYMIAYMIMMVFLEVKYGNK